MIKIAVNPKECFENNKDKNFNKKHKGINKIRSVWVLNLMLAEFCL